MSTKRFEGPMREAILEAGKGRFDTTPNPTVGAVLLHDGCVVARGHHARAGGPHAEIACLEDARSKCISTRGMTMVVTLEPCNHQGRTGPCSEALIKAGITRVVIGASDPNPKATGGAERLRQAGVDVIEGVLEPECRLLAADYLTWLEQKRPFVMLKLASTLDGRIATRTGVSRWITGDKIRSEVHCMRSGIGRAGGAIMVGGSTFRSDDPELTARGVYAGGRQPKAFVFTQNLPEPDADCHLLQRRPDATTFLVPQDVAKSDRAKKLQDKGCTILTSSCAEDAPGEEHLRSILSALNPEKIPYILCEGGGRLGLLLMESGLCDLFYLHMATSILGDNQGRALFDGRTPETLDEMLKLRHIGTRSVGHDLAMTWVPENAWYAPSLGELSGSCSDFLWAPSDSRQS
ncbi:MAG: bifunctional diaminohydroxyphosphoribosylaminopyrimidine deaminase/5-amino-6-(5-phosphoribosylamino)uracil reductase RibD [Desulfovibrionaceae bacterium]|nr:bifunctional diaminohydroxyphosphoribosylaminopyrimidine deaminase/5-amino-6-(5-phosphoribosylamino)uracil reductase RibD [Desulfovibrionaceae bacterium]